MRFGYITVGSPDNTAPVTCAFLSIRTDPHLVLGITPVGFVPDAYLLATGTVPASLDDPSDPFVELRVNVVSIPPQDIVSFDSSAPTGGDVTLFYPMGAWPDSDHFLAWVQSLEAGTPTGEADFHSIGGDSGSTDAVRPPLAPELPAHAGAPGGRATTDYAA